jgi:hypothetical protein
MPIKEEEETVHVVGFHYKAHQDAVSKAQNNQKTL